jgi:hypothetical protein
VLNDYFLSTREARIDIHKYFEKLSLVALAMREYPEGEGVSGTEFYVQTLPPGFAVLPHASRKGEKLATDFVASSVLCLEVNMQTDIQRDHARTMRKTMTRAEVVL